VDVARLALDDASIVDASIRDLLVSATPEMPSGMKRSSFLPLGGVKRVTHQVYEIASRLAQKDLEDAWLSLFYLVYDTFKKPGYNETRAGHSPPALLAWNAARNRSPAALLDVLAPPPRIPSASVVIDVVGDLDVDALRERLAATSAVDRMIALRAITPPRLEKLIPELMYAAVRDESADVRAEAQEVARQTNKKVKAKLAAAGRPFIDSDDPRVCAAALLLLQKSGAPIAGADLARFLRHRAAEVQVAACASVGKGAGAEVEEGVTAILQHGDDTTRVAALRAATLIGVSHVVRPALWVEALRTIVREGPDVRLATYLLGEMGEVASPAALDVIRALPKSEGAAAEALIAFGAIPPEGRTLLEEYARSADSDVAEGASEVLETLVGVVAVTLEDRVKRLATELASENPEVRSTAVYYTKQLGSDGAALLPTLRALGDQIARDPARESELSSVREALVAIGCPVDDLPHPPSHFEVVAGTPPREQSRDGELMIGELTRKFEHGHVGVHRSSKGLWNVETGKLLFLVDDAEVLGVVPGGREAVAVRTVVRPDATYGGTSRSDVDWCFERRAIPSGAVLASMPLSGPFTYGSPSMLDVRVTEEGTVATVFCADEDHTYLFQIALGDDASPDRLLDEAPRPWNRRTHGQVMRGGTPTAKKGPTKKVARGSGTKKKVRATSPTKSGKRVATKSTTDRAKVRHTPRTKK